MQARHLRGHRRSARRCAPVAVLCAIVVATLLLPAAATAATGSAIKPVSASKVRRCGGGYPLSRPEVFNVRATNLSCPHAIAVVMTAYGQDLRSDPMVGSFRCTFRQTAETAGVYRCAWGTRVVTASFSVF